MSIKRLGGGGAESLEVQTTGEERRRARWSNHHWAGKRLKNIRGRERRSIRDFSSLCVSVGVHTDSLTRSQDSLPRLAVVRLVSSCIPISAAHFVMLAVVYAGLLPPTGRDWADVVAVSLPAKGTDAEALWSEDSAANHHRRLNVSASGENQERRSFRKSKGQVPHRPRFQTKR